MSKAVVLGIIEQQAQMLCDAALSIWSKPELAFREAFAAELQTSILRHAGFRITAGIAQMPTAFLAEYGEGKPIIGVLGEYDALGSLSQKVSSTRESAVEGGNGHGCGHNLLGTGCVGAALAIQKALQSGAVTGTIRYYGCPAEEIVAGKVFMARAGVFNDLDACLYWHPASMNTVLGCSFLAMNSARFRFHGIAAHAAAAPHLGRSALDAVELMNVGANYLREHIPEQARIHYVITNGGAAPNVVPEEAEVWYYVRAPKRGTVDEIFCRLLDIAKGASLMTGTTFESALESACYEVLPNDSLGEVIMRNMFTLGGPRYSEPDRAFARALADSFGPGQKERVMEGYFAPPELLAATLHEGVVKNRDSGRVMSGSVDVGDVSYLVPFAQFTTAAWPVGTAPHTWQATAASGSGIGLQAMLFAAKTLACTIYDLLSDLSSIDAAKREFAEATANFRYESPLADDIVPRL